MPGQGSPGWWEEVSDESPSGHITRVPCSERCYVTYLSDFTASTEPYQESIGVGRRDFSRISRKVSRIPV
jgi:hypothetical protein